NCASLTFTNGSRPYREGISVSRQFPVHMATRACPFPRSCAEGWERNCVWCIRLGRRRVKREAVTTRTAPGLLAAARSLGSVALTRGRALEAVPADRPRLDPHREVPADRRVGHRDLVDGPLDRLPHG